MIKITTHTIVKNEENWVWYALSAWLPYAAKMLVVDDNSDDATRKIIQTFKNPKLIFQETDLKTPKDYTAMRNIMVSQTETDWFLVLDGDEIWNQKTIERFLLFLKNCPKNIGAVFMQTRNCIGDIYHYLPEEAGHYNILDKKGHLTIRAYRKLPTFSWQAIYPLEKYADEKGTAINDLPSALKYFNGFYWHTTNLPRSSSSNIKNGNTDNTK